MTNEQLQARNSMLESDNRLLIENHKKEVKQLKDQLKIVQKERDEYKEKYELEKRKIK